MNKPVDKEQVNATHQQQPDKNIKKTVNEQPEAAKNPQHGYAITTEKHGEKGCDKNSGVPSPK